MAGPRQSLRKLLHVHAATRFRSHLFTTPIYRILTPGIALLIPSTTIGVSALLTHSDFLGSPTTDSEALSKQKRG